MLLSFVYYPLTAAVSPSFPYRKRHRTSFSCLSRELPSSRYSQINGLHRSQPYSEVDVGYIFLTISSFRSSPFVRCIFRNKSILLSDCFHFRHCDRFKLRSLTSSSCLDRCILVASLMLQSDVDLDFAATVSISNQSLRRKGHDLKGDLSGAATTRWLVCSAHAFHVIWRVRSNRKRHVDPPPNHMPSSILASGVGVVIFVVTHTLPIAKQHMILMEPTSDACAHSSFFPSSIPSHGVCLLVCKKRMQNEKIEFLTCTIRNESFV